MADKIAGIPKKYAVVGIAAAGGIIAYAWWRNGQAGTEVPADPGLEPAVDEYESPLGNSGTNSTGTYPGNVDPDAIDTNSEWTQAAVEFLTSAGYDSGTVLAALGKYLSFKGLSAAEAQIVMAARASVGDPPVGGPYPIKDALPTPTVPAPKPTTPAPMKQVTGLRATTVSPTYVKLDWNPLSGIKGYVLYQNGKRIESVVYSSSGQTGLKRNTVYKFAVRGIYAGDKLGPMSSTITVRTKK